MTEDIILQMKHITKRFPGVTALDDAALELRRGEVHAVIGENGAGKSTLMKVLLGLYHADEGSIVYNGKQVRFHGPADALHAGISMIHQEISLVAPMSVAENIWLGRENLFLKMGLLNRKARIERTHRLLESLDIHVNPEAVVSSLSVAQMQLVEIARAVSYEPQIIIMDEPTSALTSTEVQLLYGIIRKLSADGITIVFISHKLDEIFELCQRVSVYRDGRYIATRDCDQLLMDELIEMIAGRKLDQMFPKMKAEIGDVVLKVSHYCKEGVFHDINFEVRRGEILGISGLMGAGRTEILRAVFGIDSHDAGELFLEGERISVHSPEDAVRHGIGMVTEDRLRLGAIHTMGVLENTTMAAFQKVCNRFGMFRPKNELALFDSVKDKVMVKYSSPHQLVGQLSGGNQQKVIIARWLLTDSKVLIFDEPTRGIDVGAKSEIHRLISQLACDGMAVIMISSEMPEIMGMSDRILVVRDGRIVYETPRETATQERLMAEAFGIQQEK